MVRGISIAPTLHLTKPRNHVQGNKDTDGDSSSRPESKSSDAEIKPDGNKPDTIKLEANKLDSDNSENKKSELGTCKPEACKPEACKPEACKPESRKAEPNKETNKPHIPNKPDLPVKPRLNIPEIHEEINPKSEKINYLLKQILSEIGIQAESCSSFEINYTNSDGNLAKKYSNLKPGMLKSPKSEIQKSPIKPNFQKFETENSSSSNCTSSSINKINVLNLQNSSKNLGKSIMLNAPVSSVKSDSRNNTPLPEKNPKISNIESMYRHFNMELPQVGNVQYQSDSSIIQVTWRQERGFEYNIKSDVYKKC